MGKDIVEIKFQSTTFMQWGKTLSYGRTETCLHNYMVENSAS